MNHDKSVSQRAHNRVQFLTIRYFWLHLLRLLGKTTMVSTRYGRFKILLQDEVIGLQLLLTHQYDTAKLRFVLEWLRQHNYFDKAKPVTMLDIGANNGVIGIQALNMHLAHQVIAVEPEPANFELLEENARLNGLTGRLRGVQNAISRSADAEVLFELDENNSGDHRLRIFTKEPDLYQEDQRDVIKVPAQPLDAIVASQPEEFRDTIQFCWMDIQGAEGLALETGSQVFANGLPTVMEVWPYGMRRIGFSQEDFLQLVARYWTHFLRIDQSRPGDIRLHEFPVSKLAELMVKLGNQGDFEDMLFVRKPTSQMSQA